MLAIRRYLIVFSMTIMVMGVFAPGLVHAQGFFSGPIVPPECTGPKAATTCTVCQLTQVAKNTLNFAIFLAIIMSAVLFAWAGFRYLTAGGNEQAATIARKTLTNVFIGLILILSAWLIVNAVMSIMLRQDLSAVLPWNKLCTN